MTDISPSEEFRQFFLYKMWRAIFYITIQIINITRAVETINNTLALAAVQKVKNFISKYTFWPGKQNFKPNDEPFFAYLCFQDFKTKLSA